MSKKLIVGDFTKSPKAFLYTILIVGTSDVSEVVIDPEREVDVETSEVIQKLLSIFKDPEDREIVQKKIVPDIKNMPESDPHLEKELSNLRKLKSHQIANALKGMFKKTINDIEYSINSEKKRRSK